MFESIFIGIYKDLRKFFILIYSHIRTQNSF